MKFGKKEFMAGLICAAIATTPLIPTEQIMASVKNQNFQAELSFASKLGLFSHTGSSHRYLGKAVSANDFFQSLSKVLHDTGVLKTTSRSEMVQMGIMPSSLQQGSITRKAATEAVLRAIMLGWNNESLPYPDSDFQAVLFRDWNPDEKYRKALDYAFSNEIIQGNPDGTFRPEANISGHEALSLLKRLHALAGEHSSARRMGLFADVPQDHFMTRPLLNLRNAGAFDLTDLGKKLNGTGKILISDLGLLLQGILRKMDCPGHIAQLKRLQKSLGHSSTASRTDLARMLEILVLASPHEASETKILYSDVKADSYLARTLERLAKAGIRMGYSNNRFAGQERVSRYEALGLINSVLNELTDSSADHQIKETEKEDEVERLKRILINRRERVRRILNRN